MHSTPRVSPRQQTAPSAPGSPLRGRYLVRNPVWNRWLYLSDLVLARLHPPRKGGAATGSPKRVLVAVGGHLGDAVIASTLLPELSRRIPGVRIGILCASWNRVVFESHPRVSWVHVVDHWKVNRGRSSLIGRLLTSRATRKRAIGEMREVGYDAAVDLAAHFPNSARLLNSAGIPTRIGYSSGGGGPLYSIAVPWSPLGHVAEEHLALLDRLVPGSPPQPHYDLTGIAPSVMEAAGRKLDAGGLVHDAYAVVHMGPGHWRKEWPLENWKIVIRELGQFGIPVVLTGSGLHQMSAAREVSKSVPGALDLSGQLDWNEFRGVLAGARLVLSVDTVAMHLAAAAGVPVVALMTGMDRTDRWQPIGPAVTVLTEPVPCAPCFRSRGCAAMSCIREITPASVMAATRSYLEVSAGLRK